MSILDWLAAANLPRPDTDFNTPDWALWLKNPAVVITGDDELVQAVEIAAQTVAGSDPLRPEFGVPIAEYFDQPLNRSTAPLVVAISNAVATYEKRAKVLSVTPEIDTRGRKKITVTFQRAGQANSRVLSATFALQ